MSDQQSHNVIAALFRGVIQRRPTALILCMNICSFGQKQFHYFKVPFTGGHTQDRLTEIRPGIDIGSFGEKAFHSSCVPVSCSRDERLILVLGSGGRDYKQDH
jgi:hypothetical protein